MVRKKRSLEEQTKRLYLEDKTKINRISKQGMVFVELRALELIAHDLQGNNIIYQDPLSFARYKALEKEYLPLRNGKEIGKKLLHDVQLSRDALESDMVCEIYRPKRYQQIISGDLAQKYLAPKK